MTILIKNGTLITAFETFEADLLIEDEKIALIGTDLQHPNADVIDAAGKLILPGGIDPHVHLDLPMFGTVSSDDHYTGHKAAAFGGTTTVMDFVVLEPQGFQHSVDLWFEKSAKAAVDYSFHMTRSRKRSHLCARWGLLHSKYLRLTTVVYALMMAVFSKRCKSPGITVCW